MAKITSHSLSHAEKLEILSKAIDSGALLRVQRILNALHPAEIADLIEATPLGQRELLWEMLEAHNEGEVLVELGEEVRSGLVQKMDAGELLDVVNKLAIDDVVDLLQSLPDTLIQETLAGMDRQNRERIQVVLAYPEDTAGGLMDTNTITVRADVCLDVVLRYLRMQKKLPSHTDSLFVVNNHNEYLGILPLSKLLTHQPDELVDDVMQKQTLAILAETKEQKVVRRFEDHNLVSAPVINKNGQLLGRITIDDVVDVLRDEAEHSVMGMAGLDEEEDLFAPAFLSAKRRAIWLGVNLLTALMAAAVIDQFTDTINQAVALAVLLPIVASMGGVAGMQTLTLVTRGLSLGQLGSYNTKELLKKELLVGFLNGTMWALILGSLAWWRYGGEALPGYQIGGVIAAAMLINLLMAPIAGVGIPLLVKRFGIDPALAGSVILTTITDIIGFFAILGLATWMLIPAS